MQKMAVTLKIVSTDCLSKINHLMRRDCHQRQRIRNHWKRHLGEAVYTRRTTYSIVTQW
jgi:hypothetical protein